MSRAVVAAAAWALTFALGSFYTAAGGTGGAGLIAPELAQRALAREPGIIAALWITGAMKFALALIVFLSANLKVPQRQRGWAARGLQVVALGLLGWGLLEGGVGLATVNGVMPPPDGWGNGHVANYYAFLWGPFWMLGGVLYLAASRALLTAAPRTKAASPAVHVG